MNYRLLRLSLFAALVAWGLSACTYLPPEIFPPESGAATTPAPGGATPAPGTGEPTDGAGDYYLNDGPPPAGSVSLAQLRQTPDAVVRNEPIAARNSRPYTVLGKRYIPYTSLQPYRKRGIASWYGKRYHGRPTALGEPYNMYAMSAAHPILPLPSYARVTRVSTGESIVVRLNDRGPFLQGREIDLSYAAAVKLGIAEAGKGEVIVESIIPNGHSVGGGNTDAGGRVEQAPAASAAVYIQLAAFSSDSAARQHIITLRGQLPGKYHTRLQVYKKSAQQYAVQLGPYNSHSAATADDGFLCQQYEQCGFLSRRYDGGN